MWRGTAAGAARELERGAAARWGGRGVSGGKPRSGAPKAAPDSKPPAEASREDPPRERLGATAAESHHETIGQQRDELARPAAPGAGERVDGEDTLEELGPGQARDGGMRRGAGSGGSASGYDEVALLRGGREDAGCTSAARSSPASRARWWPRARARCPACGPRSARCSSGTRRAERGGRRRAHIQRAASRHAKLRHGSMRRACSRCAARSGEPGGCSRPSNSSSTARTLHGNASA